MLNRDEPDNEVNQYLEEPLQLSLPIKLTTPKEVSKVISKLHQKKAPGYDLITSKLLRMLPKKGLVFLTILYNAIMRASYYPDLWKVSQIIMIPKPGKEPNKASTPGPKQSIRKNLGYQNKASTRNT